MRDSRGPWYLLTGVILGLALGLVYAWVISPVRFVDNPPSSMREDFKNQYRALIAVAYTASQDLGRAQARLALLGDPDPYRELAAQAQNMIAQGGHPGEARALGELAAAIRPVSPPGVDAGTAISSGSLAPGEGTLQPTDRSASPGTPVETAPSTMLTATQVITATPAATPSPTLTPTPNRTPLPTRTPTPTEGLPFVVLEQTPVCNPGLQDPLIQVYAQDVDGRPIPGVEVLVIWPEGDENFFTGLKPEIGLGYGDFRMTPGVVYSLRLADGGGLVSDLTAEECETSGGDRYWGSWSLVFGQP